MPDGSLCELWTNLDFVPGETYRITTHNGYYDEDRDYEQRVGRYSGKSLLNDLQRRGIDDQTFTVVDEVPDEFNPTPEQQELLKIQVGAKLMTIKTGMETIKATYKSLEPYIGTRNFSVTNKIIAQIAKQNEMLDANFQDLVKTVKKSPNIPQKEKVEVISGGYKEILKFYTEQNQAFISITKELGFLPKGMQKTQNVINKLIEKYMKEIDNTMTDMK